jgi:hypothetical protein
MGFGFPETLNGAQDSISQVRGAGGQGRRNRPNAGPRRSAGFAFGRGPCGSSTSDSDFVPGSQLETLKARAGYLEKALDGIKRRILKLEPETEGNQQV